MMRRFFNIAAILLFAATSVQAQKIDARLTNLLSSTNKVTSAKGASEKQQIDTLAVKQDINVSFNKDCSVRSVSAIAMVKEGCAIPTAALQQLGVEIRTEIGNLLILRIPAESLLALDDMEEIESVSADQMNHVMNNNAREKSKVTEVATLEKAQSHNLPQAYTGKGVMVGVIDTGMDFNHAAFRNADGSTRVKMAMVAGASDDVVVFKNVDDIMSLSYDGDNESHGTHVACTAGGSIIDGLNKQGVAPEADLMLCGLGGKLYDSNIIYAIKQMFAFAKEQGEPCVINVSIGNVGHFHDGTPSGVIQGLREYYKTESKEGRIVVFSSGNSSGFHAAIYTTLPAAGADGYHLKTVLGESEEYYYDGEKVNSYTEIDNFFYDLTDNDFDVEVKVVDVTTGKIYTLEEKPLYYSDLEIKKKSMSKDNHVDSRNNKRYIRYSLDNTQYYFKEPNLKLAYFVKGTAGTTFRCIDKREKDAAGFHSYGLAGYTDGQDNGAFNIHACGEEVISVGSYFSSRVYTNINGELFGSPDKNANDKVAKYSSWGTDDNGVNHPDVVAPGSIICSAYNIYDSNFFDSEGQYDTGTSSNILSEYVTLFGRNHFFGAMGGTSMAAPHTTGIIALWLQAKPTLTYADVRNLIKETSVKDEYIKNLDYIPSHNIIQAGAGKIDALAGLLKLTGTTAIKTVETTPATMYELDDNCYNTRGQRVNKNAKGIVIYKGKVYLNK